MQAASSLLAATPSALKRAAVSIASAPLALEDTIARPTVEGVAWLCRNGGGDLIAQVPRRAWIDPAAAGWQPVKQNARREVWRFTAGGRSYYVKYFYCRGLRDRVASLLRPRAGEAEWRSGLYVARAGVPAAAPVAYAPRVALRSGRECAVLVSDAVEPALPLNEFWRQLQTDGDIRRRRADSHTLIERLGEMIARAHQAGFEHRDMHAGNILVQTIAPRAYRTVLVDLHSAHRGQALHDAAVVRNLAQLNQWFRRHASIGDRLRFLRAYLRWRNAFETALPQGRPLGLDFPQLARALAEAARDHADRLGLRRDHRVFRDGRYFARLRLGGGWSATVIRSSKHVNDDSRASRLCFDERWWAQQLASPLRWFEPAAGESCKNSHSASVRRAVLEHPDEPLPVILKRPLARNVRRVASRLLSTSRSRRAWCVAYALLNRDVPTARPLAVLERRAGPFVLDSVLVTEALPGAIDLEAYLRREHERRGRRGWAALKRGLAPLLAAHVRRLAERGFAHRDCKASNVLVRDAGELRLLWIDLDGVRRVGRVSTQAEHQALARLHVSLLSLPGLTRTDRVRFLKAYLARFGAPTTAWREAWAQTGEIVRRKLANRARRRAWKLANYGRL